MYTAVPISKKTKQMKIYAVIMACFASARNNLYAIQIAIVTTKVIVKKCGANFMPHPIDSYLLPQALVPQQLEVYDSHTI